MIDLTDPAAAFLASVTVTDPQEVLTLLGKAPADTIEVRLRALRAMIDLGAAAAAEHPGLDVFADAKRLRDLIARPRRTRTGGWPGTTACSALASGDLHRAAAAVRRGVLGAARRAGPASWRSR